MRTIITIPTYNEAENIARLIRTIRSLGPEYEVLVADDDSPDGTWHIVQEVARTDPGVHLLHRTQNKGRGSAGSHAFQVAMEMGADRIGEMDADFSHDPRHLPALVKALDDADVVLGSRAVPGGGESGRPFSRRLITRLANLYIRTVLWLPVRDCNSGYRMFRRRVFEAIPPLSLRAKGPDIVQELLFKCHKKGFRIVEIPIHFVERAQGMSKLDLKRLYRGYTVVLHLRFLSMTGKLFEGGHSQ